ncbi:MAG: phosphoribosylamine--glycine ligase [Sphaerochaeta sp.]
MRVLVLGSGAKDHAITWLFSRSKLIEGLFVAHGNVGTESIAVNLKYVNPSSPESVYRACLVHNIDTVFIGTEEPLQTGVVDFLNSKKIRVIGAPSKALRIENDRAFSKEFMNKHKVPTPIYKLFSDISSLDKYLSSKEGKHFIIKSNTQAPSRVMLDSTDKNKLLKFASTLLQQNAIVLEEYTVGLPLTATLFLDNKGYMTLPFCSEYTKTEEGGMPTGGMGAICPVPISQKDKDRIKNEVIKPLLEGMKSEGLAYKGILTLSIVINPDDGPLLVDMHVRFNDPATQAIVPLIQSDIIDIINAMSNDTISDFKLETSDDTCAAVVIASEGYPENPITGMELDTISSPVLLNTFSKDIPLFFYGCVDRMGGKIITTGGRCVTVVGRSNNIVNATKAAYSATLNINFPGSWYREDIGVKFYNSLV